MCVYVSSSIFSWKWQFTFSSAALPPHQPVPLSSENNVVGHCMATENILSDLLAVDIPQAGNPALYIHVSSAPTLTSFLSRQEMDGLMLPGFWSPLMLTSALWQAHSAWLLQLPRSWAVASLVLTAWALTTVPWNRHPLSEVQSRKTSCLWFSSNLIHAIVPNSACTKNPAGNSNYSYLTLISPGLRISGFLAEIWTTLTVPPCLTLAGALFISSLLMRQGR